MFKSLWSFDSVHSQTKIKSSECLKAILLKAKAHQYVTDIMQIHTQSIINMKTKMKCIT